MRRLAWILVALVALLVAAAAVVPGWVDWTSHRERIEAAVKDASGLDLDVAGDISISLLPQPSLRLQEVAWTSTTGDILTVPQIDATLRLDRLLLGEARAEVLTLIAPQLASGREEALLAGATGLLRSPLLGDLDHIEILSADWRFGEGERLVIDRLLVQQRERAGAISYEFDLIGEVWEESLVLRGRIHGLGSCEGPLTLDAELGELLARASFAGAWACAEEGVALTGTLESSGPDLLAALAFVEDPLGAAVSGKPQPFVAKTSLSWEGALLRLPDLALSAGSLEAAADLTLTGEGERTLQGTLRLPLLDLDAAEAGSTRSLAEAFALLLRRHLARARLGISLDAWTYREAALGPSRAEIRLDGGAYGLTLLDLALPGASRLTLEGRFGTAAGALLQGRFTLASENLRSLLLWAGAEEASLPEARLRRLLLSGRSEGRWGDLRLEPLALSLDALEGQGRAALTWGQGSARPVIDLQLTAGTLNLEAYGSRPLSTVLQALRRSLDGRLALVFDEITLGGYAAEGVTLEAVSDAGALLVDRLEVDDLFGGRLVGRGLLSGDPQAIEADVTIAGSASGLPADLISVPARLLAGVGDYQADLSLVGPLASPAVAGEVAFLGGQLFVSGLWSARPEERGDWALALQHPDMTALLSRLTDDVTLSQTAPRALDLSGLLRFGEAWSLVELGGLLGPMTLRGGSYRSAQGALTLALGPLDTDPWRMQGDQGLPLVLSDLPDLDGQVTLTTPELAGPGWSLQEVSLQLQGDGEGAHAGALSAASEAGRLTASARMTAEEELSLDLELTDWPLAPFLPALPDLATPYGAIDADLSLTARGGSVAELLASSNGALVASGEAGLALVDGELAGADRTTLGRRLLGAVAGGAASGLARITNLTAGLGRLLQGITGRTFALRAMLSLTDGRLEIGQADMTADDLTVSAEGWLDFAAWQGDYSWSLTFAEQGTAYYRERRQGPLLAPDILRDGLLFRGATPPG